MAATSQPSPPYAERLRLVEQLAVRYPGQVNAASPLSQYGMWAGIFIQTQWQQSSGRDQVPFWHVLNFGLSVEPSSYAAEFEAQGSSGEPSSLCARSPTAAKDPVTPGAAGPALSGQDVCQAWMNYFVATKQGAPAAALQHLLWHGHTLALVERLRTHRAELDRSATATDLERNFWASWLEIVFTLDALNYSTDGIATLPASVQLMPTCSPIGSPGCQLTAADLGTKLAFVSALASRPASIDRIFQLYDLGHRNPAAVLPFEMTDPAMASAVTAVLAVSHG